MCTLLSYFLNQKRGYSTTDFDFYSNAIHDDFGYGFLKSRVSLQHLLLLLIMAVLKGLKVYIEVNSRPLPESTPASQEQSPSKVLRNVEVIAGQKFAVRCKIPEGFCDKPPISAYSIRLYVNGEFADAGVYLNAPRDDAFRGRIHYEAGKQIVRAFKFEKIQIGMVKAGLA